LPPVEGRPALFLDRDGVLNELVFYPDTGEWESPRTPAELRIVPGAGPALRALRAAGWPLFIVSNQPSFAKGKTTLEALRAVAEALEARLLQEGVAFEAAYYCYHHPEGKVPGYSGPCQCRKPSPHFLHQAADRFGLDLKASWLVGDQDGDLLCARNAGCRSLLIPAAASSAKRGSVRPDAEAASLSRLPAFLGLPGPYRSNKEAL
jgi:D-glycero-D-manno-heptose 1,7-bisphosphate phosphatase